MGKKSKSKSKNKPTSGSSIGAAGAATQQRKISSTQSPPVRDDASVYQSHLDKDTLCTQFDSLIASSPEEGIQAVRDLYLNVLKKKITNQKRITFLQERKQSLNTDIARNKDLISEENTVCLQVTAQKDKLQSLSERLTEKKDSLLQEAKVRAEAEKAKQQQRTSDLIGETQEISAKLQEYDSLRHEYAAENNRLKDKLRDVLDRYSTQENDFNATMEQQVAKIAAATGQLEEQSVQLENGVLGRDDLEKGLLAALAAEEALKEEVRGKAARFEEFQDALTTSNETFQGFKTRMEEQTAAIAALEQENKQLSAKKERTEQAIKVMSAEIVASRQAVFNTTQKKIERLSNLCTALKTEIEDLTAKQGD